MIKSKNLIALLICFCISIISFNFENIDFYNKYLKNSDFYNSYELESILYEVATNSVYTVAGDKASEKMLNYKKESIEIISNHILAQIFVINNDSKQVYSNNIFDFNKYKKAIKDYPCIYEINFKENTMYKLNGNERIRVSTKHFGNIANKRKEDVTTYIAIPYDWDIGDIKDTNDSEPLYVKYIQFYKNTRDAYNFIGSKIIAGSIIVAYLFFYIFINKEEDKKILITNTSKIVVLIILALLLSILQSGIYSGSILYPIINTVLLYIIYYCGSVLLGYEDENKLSYKISTLKSLNKIRNNSLKHKLGALLITLVQPALFIKYINSGYDGLGYIYIMAIIALNVILLVIIINEINNIEKIRSGIEEIKRGNLDYKIKIKKDILFGQIVSDINEIGESINIAVEERLKSERMKNELITNVSHDLKTPLTAMINYISLIKKEDILPEHIKGYVQVLDKRSQRLKILIEDLFEASKIGSNNIELNLEKNDVNQLLNQVIVEMEEYIGESKLDFIINVPEDEVFILADGQKTFRVFENIISNILKYSLEGTRVYIDLKVEYDKVYIKLKNISKYQLNFDAREITERFTRGDLSRNTEGSGLGLAIAKGFVEAQGGNLNIDIIGDLFSLTINFDLLRD